MDEKIKAFLEEQENHRKTKDENERQKILIELGLYEKEYEPNNDSTNDEYPFAEWDEKASENKYFKKIPYEVTEEEYRAISEYYIKEDESESNNRIVVALKILAAIIFIGGFIAGFVFGNVEVVKGIYYTYTDTEFSFSVALTYWVVSLVSGFILLGLAEIIKLLEKIAEK